MRYTGVVHSYVWGNLHIKPGTIELKRSHHPDNGEEDTYTSPDGCRIHVVQEKVINSDLKNSNSNINTDIQTGINTMWHWI